MSKVPAWLPRVSLGLVLIGTLAAVRAFSSPSGTLTEVVVAGAPTLPHDETLAARVRYSTEFDHEGGAILVTARGPSQTLVEVSLVPADPLGDVRIQHIEIPGDVRFERVDPGAWSIRAFARGPRGRVRVTADRAGASGWFFGVASAALLIPLALFRKT